MLNWCRWTALFLHCRPWLETTCSRFDVIRQSKLKGRDLVTSEMLLQGALCFSERRKVFLCLNDQLDFQVFVDWKIQASPKLCVHFVWIFAQLQSNLCEWKDYFQAGYFTLFIIQYIYARYQNKQLAKYCAYIKFTFSSKLNFGNFCTFRVR